MMQQSRSLTKIGFVASLIFIVQGVVSLVRAVVFPESFSRYAPHVSSQGGGLRSFILSLDTGLVISLLLVVLVLSMISTQPRNEWKAWGASFGSAAIVSLFNWFSIMEGNFRIIVFPGFVGCNLYAFWEFRCCLKLARSVLTTSNGHA
jgi:hypothetical protein